MQTAINPGLAQVLGAMDVISPVTPEGTPTVAAQVMQAAQQATMPQVAMPQVAQQAGLGGQIRAMQMQDAQKDLMEEAMRQATPPAGIEGLNPQMGNYAEGGIVGYADGAYVKNPLAILLEKLKEYGLPTRGGGISDRQAPASDQINPERALEILSATTPMQDIPEVRVQEPPVRQAAPSQAAPSQAVAPQGIAAALGERARKEAESMQGPASAQDILARQQRDQPVYDQFLRSQGIDPDAFTKRGEEDKALIEQQRALLRERMEREQGKDTFLGRAGAALRGFRQMKGQGTGDAFMRAYDNLNQMVESGQMRIDQFRDLEIRLNELEVTRRRSLEDARRATAEGRWKDAQQSLANERAAANEIKRLQIPTYMQQATAQIEEKKVAESAAARQEASMARRGQDQDRTMLAAQGRLTEAEKARAQVAEKNKAILSLPKDDKNEMTRRMRENAENEMRQADENVAAARALYNRLTGQALGIATNAPQYASNPKTGQRIVSTDGGKTWQPVR